MTAQKKLVIIGTGLAGYMLAKEWRKLDTLTPLILITQDDGNFYSKPLLSTALANKKQAHELVVFNSEAMAKDLNATILTHTSVLAIDSPNKQIVLENDSIPVGFQEAGEARASSRSGAYIEYVSSEMSTQQSQNLKGDGYIDYGNLVLACGADLVLPTIKGNAQNEIAAVNNLIDYQKFRHWLKNKKNIAIMGTGLVGCEFANDLVQAGYQITLISPDHHPLSSLVPSPIGFALQQAFSQQGVTFKLNRWVVEVNHYQDKFQIGLDNGEKLIVDGVFSAVGLRPQLRLAQSAAVKVNEGIVVDRWFRTSDFNIFALGDCAEVNGLIKQYVAPILQGSKALAKTLAGESTPVHYPIMPVVIKTPFFPLVCYPPPKNKVGEWHYEGESQHQRALFFDHEGQLQGYVLAGEKVREKMALAKELPLVFSE